MIIANLIKKYAIILFALLLIEEVIYYADLEAFSYTIAANTDSVLGRMAPVIVKIAIYYLSNLIISIFAIGDLRKFKSRFYLIPLIILLNKVVGTCILLVYLLYLKQQENEKEVDSVYPIQ